MFCVLLHLITSLRFIMCQIFVQQFIVFSLFKITLLPWSHWYYFFAFIRTNNFILNVRTIFDHVEFLISCIYIYIWALTFLLNDFFRIIQFQGEKMSTLNKIMYIFKSIHFYLFFFSTIVIKRPQICYERISSKLQQVSKFRFLKTSLIEDDDIPDSLHVSTIYTDHERLFTPIIWYHAVYMYKAHIIHVNVQWIPCGKKMVTSQLIVKIEILYGI